MLPHQGLFERELLTMMHHAQYPAEDLTRLVRTPAAELSDEAQWLRLIAIQAGLEFVARADAYHL